MSEKFFDLFSYSFEESQSMTTTMSYNHCTLLKEIDGHKPTKDFHMLDLRDALHHGSLMVVHTKNKDGEITPFA